MPTIQIGVHESTGSEERQAISDAVRVATFRYAQDYSEEEAARIPDPVDEFPIQVGVDRQSGPGEAYVHMALLPRTAEFLAGLELVLQEAIPTVSGISRESVWVEFTETDPDEWTGTWRQAPGRPVTAESLGLA